MSNQHTPSPQSRAATVRSIIDVTCQVTGLSLQQLLGPCREHSMVEARHVAMWVSMRLTGESLMALGKAFHRDHSSVIHGIRLIEKKCQTDERLMQLRREIMRCATGGQPAVVLWRQPPITLSALQEPRRRPYVRKSSLDGWMCLRTAEPWSGLELAVVDALHNLGCGDPFIAQLLDRKPHAIHRAAVLQRDCILMPTQPKKRIYKRKTTEQSAAARLALKARVYRLRTLGYSSGEIARKVRQTRSTVAGLLFTPYRFEMCRQAWLARCDKNAAKQVAQQLQPQLG